MSRVCLWRRARTKPAAARNALVGLTRDYRKNN
jgi:hypothetical protein